MEGNCQSRQHNAIVSSGSNEEIAIIYKLKLFWHQFSDGSSCLINVIFDIKYDMFVVFKNVISSPLYRFGNII